MNHPHAYGDKIIPQPFLFVKGGSSPRVWGQVDIYNYTTAFSRIIPTRMGTSFHIPLFIVPL